MEPTEEQRRAIRTAARNRKRAQRARDQQKRFRRLEAQQEVVERAERNRRNLCFYGESKPGRNSDNCADELMIHRQFLRALGEVDVKEKETLRDVARRTFNAWVSGPFTSRGHDGTTYVPAFSRTQQRFDDTFGFVLDGTLFEQTWSPPKNCSGDELIDVSTLPELPPLPKTVRVEEAMEEPAPPPPTPPAPIPQPQPNTVTFSWTPPAARHYLNGGK